MCENIRTDRPVYVVGEGPQYSTILARFWSKVASRSVSECWPWLGGRSSCGYGSFRLTKTPNVKRAAHIVSWSLANGPVPAGYVVRHSCDNRPCVNPSHLVLGTHADNVADRVARGRSAVGERNGRARLTTAQALAILNSSEDARALALRYGVTHWTVNAIRNGESWRHLGRVA